MLLPDETDKPDHAGDACQVTLSHAPPWPDAGKCHVHIAAQGLPKTLVRHPALNFLGVWSHDNQAMDLVFSAEAGDFAGAKVRKTNEIPPRVSVFDLIAVVKDVELNNARTELLRIQNEHPEVAAMVAAPGSYFKFPGRGQRNTPVTGARGVVVILNLLSGPRAARFRLKCADIVVRALGGDESLVAEIRRNAEAQAALPAEAPMRLFGETVEAERPPKRKAVVLEEDRDVYAARKRALLGELQRKEQDARLEGFATMLGSLEVLYARLSDQAVPGVLQNILIARSNTTNQVLAAAGAIVQARSEGPPALPAPESQLTLQPSVTPTAPLRSRVTVREVAVELRVPSVLMTEKELGKVGKRVGRAWLGAGGKSFFEEGGRWYSQSLDDETGRYLSEEMPGEPDWSIGDLLQSSRLKYSAAFGGAVELGVRGAHDVWTYPAEKGRAGIAEALREMKMLPEDDLYA